MLSIAHAIGVDPGLVHTGVVRLEFNPATRLLNVEHHLVDGPDADAVATWIQLGGRADVYVERYKQRHTLSADAQMIRAEHDLRRALPGATFLTNMGIKRVVSDDLMRMLDVWSFPVSTHHQDLRSAARIALLGLLKKDSTNVVVAEAVRSHLDGQPWAIVHA